MKKGLKVNVVCVDGGERKRNGVQGSDVLVLHSTRDTRGG